MEKIGTLLLPRSAERVPYNPPATLFLTLATTPATKDGIRDFADTYGLLKLDSDTADTLGGFARERARLGFAPPKAGAAVKVLRTLRRTKSPNVVAGEPLDDWKRAIGELSYMVDRWEVSRGQVELEGGQSGLAKIDLQHTLNEHPKTAAALEVLLTDVRVTVAKPRTPESLPDRFIDFRQTLRLVAQSLPGHCWLQLALAVDGGSRFRRCLACQRMFTIAPSGIRPSRLTCSNNCRVRVSYYRSLYRSRRISIADVAKRLNSDPLTVRAWAGVANKKKEGR
jgi:hypothetical protein